ncbi:hypothetical protein QFZ62_002754 [Clavibacter sp. B3I6]|uniref:hypothetical protein n=1 Tax=Clavibacter sp. B3I6 TaxID=3042268 RepID=UPI002780937C|nr:hypothetical protein [Clavibacter sp. B3I6]MDQ0745446.1 hypothetical protein [Clavibacter sp. B3I6]
MPDDGASALGDAGARHTDDAAFARRLRDDAATGRHLEALRRDAYGRAATDARLVPVPDALRRVTGIEDPALPAPLVALLTEEARLVAEGRALLDGDRGAARVEPIEPAEPADDRRPGPTGADPVPPRDAPASGDPGARADPLDPRTRRPVPLRRRTVVAVVAAALVVGALGGTVAADLRDAPDPATATSAADGRGSRVEAMGTPDGRRLSAASALPAFTAPPPPHVAATEEELAAAYRQEADIDWDAFTSDVPDAVRPDVALERVVSPEDFPAQQVACLTAAGYHAEATGDGGITYQDGDPVAIWTCHTRFPMQLPDPLSDAELAYRHDYIVSFVLPCYAMEGSPYMDAVPAREDFVARTRSGAPWFPYPDDADNALLERCPSAPPAWR